MGAGPCAGRTAETIHAYAGTTLSSEDMTGMHISEHRDVTILNKRKETYPQAFVASQVHASGVPRILGKQGQRRHYRSCFCLFWAVPSGCLASYVWRELSHVFVCNYLRSICLLHLGTSSNSPYLWSQPSIRKFPEFRSVR